MRISPFESKITNHRLKMARQFLAQGLLGLVYNE
jgi:hypothetical protein